MVADQVALVVVRPDENLDSIIKKVREAQAPTVQLLIPDNTPALQTQQDVARLCRSTASRGIALVPISSDEQTLEAFRLSQVQTISVKDTRVRHIPPLKGGNGEPARAAAPAPAAALPAAPETVEESDAEFLRALDEMASTRLAGRATGDLAPPVDEPVDNDDDIFAALDDLSSTMQAAPPRGSSNADYDAFAAELDALDELPTRHQEQVEPEPRRRVRPEDIELTDEDRQRAAGTGRRQQAAVAPPPPPRRERTPRPPAEPIPPRRDTPRREVGRAAADRRETGRTAGRPAWLPLAIGAILLLLLVVIGAVLLFGGQITVVVTPPILATEELPFDTQTIPVVAAGSAATPSAVQAEEVRTDASFSVTGQVSDAVAVPSSSASGVVLFLNQSSQAVPIPAGTEFIAANPQGQEVRFVSSEDVTIPPSTTARQGAQIITNLGQAQVAVSARAPGSASNVGANSIQQIVPPGQAPIAVRGGGALEVLHDPIGGGAEQMVRVVRESDVQALLGEALTGLNAQARQQLEQEAGSRGLALESTAVTPTPDMLAQGQGYELVVNPPIGQPLADPASTTFELRVRGLFSALATPPGLPLQEQIQAALPEQLLQAGLLTPGDGRAPLITSWAWDSQRLTVSGILRPTGEQARIDPAALAAIKASLLGKSYAEAEAALESFVQQGVISSYALPNVESLPGWDFQIDIQVAP